MPSKPKMGRQIATQKLCAICSHEKRGEVEDYLYLHSAGEPTASGQRVSLQWLHRESEALFGQRFSLDSLRTHRDKHYLAAGGPAAHRNPEDVGEALELHREKRRGDRDVFLRDVIARVQERMESGELKPTIDHAIKAEQEITRRRVDESEQALMGALAGAVGAAIQRIPLPDGKPAPALESGDVIDAEVVSDGDEG